MTTINDITDLLRILKEQPEWAAQVRAALLGEEFLSMPEVLAQIARNVADLNNAVGLLQEGQTQLQEGQTQLGDRLGRVEEGQVRVEGRLDRVEEGQARVEGRLDRVEEGQARVEGRLDRMQEGQNRMQGQLGHLIGTDYEMWAGRLAGRIAKRNFNLADAEVLYLCWEYPRTPDLLNILGEAEDQQRITPQEHDDLLLADIVVRGQREHETVYLVMEVSFTAHQDDFRRAATRAALLHKATGADTLPVVLGRNLAQELPVDREGQPLEQPATFIQISSRNDEEP